MPGLSPELYSYDNESTVHQDLTAVPGLQFIDHVAIAVRQGDLDRQVRSYSQLGFVEIHREDVYGQDLVREALLRIGGGPNLIQLLEPLSAESPVQKLIDRNGGHGGFAHLAYRVANAQHAFDHMKNSGFQIIDEAPRKGSRGTTIFFIHPKSLGYLVEIVEDPSGP
jgi:methylmalonyl-CoA/ethylmalonyl-CoA epimerase